MADKKKIALLGAGTMESALHRCLLRLAMRWAKL